MAGITYSVSVEGLDKASKAVEKFKKEMASNDDALRLGRLQIQMDKERIAGNDALAKKLSSQIELEKELIAIRSRGGLLGQTGAMEVQAKERAAQREMEIDRELAASAQQKAQLDADILAKSTAANANTLKLTGLQTQADRARVQGKELEAKKLEHQITLERELIRIQGLGGTQQQRDQMAAHARAQTVLADKQAEIAQAQKLANIQRGNMPGQPMSEGAKRSRMMNVSAQLQDVAVQAQMGTSISTIAGQQGPQLISALGGSGKAAGMAAGAAIAIGIGVGLYNAGKQANETFNVMKLSAEEFIKTETSLAKTGGLQSLESSLKSSRKAVEDLQKSGEDLKGFWSTFGQYIGVLQGGASPEQRTRTQAKLEKEAQEAEAKKLGRIDELSRAEYDAANLRSKGKDVEAAAAERKAKLDQEIAKIQDSGISGVAKTNQIEAARKKSKKEEDEIAADLAAKKKRAVAEQISTGLRGLGTEEGDRQANAIDRSTALNEKLASIDRDATLDEAARKEQKDAARAKSEAERAKEEKDAKEKAAKETNKMLDEMLEDIEKDEKKIADRRKAKREQDEKDAKATADRIAKNDADARTKAAADFSKIEDERRKKLEDRLKIDEKMRLSQDRLKKAQEEYKRTANGSLAQEQAAAKVAAAKMEVEDRREAQIQRAMGGSIAEGQARRSERAEERARARAERIVTNREINKKRAEMERDRKPRAEIEAALDAIRGRKKDEVKDQQMAIKAAVESSATSLQILVGKLTVA